MNKKLAQKDGDNNGKVEEKERKYYTKKSVIITPRDVIIEDFLERVGWANYEQVRQYLRLNNYELTSEALRSRLSRLTKFGRLRSTRSIESTYFALSKESKRENELVNALRHDRLAHENCLINMVLSCDKRFISRFKFPREIRAGIAVGEKSGPIPDLIFLNKNGDDDTHIEYERTAKSRSDIRDSIYNWLRSPKRVRHQATVLVICENSLIRDKYLSVIDEQIYHNSITGACFDVVNGNRFIDIKNTEHIYTNSGKSRLENWKMRIRIIEKNKFDLIGFLD